ncbi:MAG: ATPase [Prevotella sp.]|nr:ATPase [Prevotella sp.]
MILIADSGSTKTDWAMVSPDVKGDARILKTQGLNPFHQGHHLIQRILAEKLLPQVGGAEVSSVVFYGSGIRPEQESRMTSFLREVFPQAGRIAVHSDMLGAARAVCGCHEGVACILGTGANSCLYDGKAIVANTPALGYILGDEGSGASLGKRLLNALYKGQLSKEIMADFESETGLSMADVIERVYRQPMANRFLASLSEFIHRHLGDEGVRQMVVSTFREFFSKNIRPYGRQDLPVSCVGSIAWHYQSELREAAGAEGFSLGEVVKSPIEGLVLGHQEGLFAE